MPASNRNTAGCPVAEHDADVCVVGGGMAGLTAALAAARHGARTILIHDRPVIGGNASSECRVHICGADRHNGIPYLRETGILEELRLENLARNPERSWATWDLILYETARFQGNLDLLLNCSVFEADMDTPSASGPAPRIAAVGGWQITTQTRHRVRAGVFIDCSGDAILAPLTGAAFRVGREARSEFNEPAAPLVGGPTTMGMTCAFAARRHDTPQPFTPPRWAHRFEKCEQLPYGRDAHRYFEMGYWWIELGGEADSIRDTEKVRDELLRITLGVWDHIKNHCPATRDAAANWALDWLQFLPAKRESRRYVGRHVLTQNDVLAEGRFDDIAAYGGWPMDDHRSAGFWGRDSEAHAATFHHSPSPYGIPYRSLVARDIPNLMFAGRCHSATHMALSSTRVMGTACSMGQAAGTAAALAVRKGIVPADMLGHTRELQQTLLRDDAYLPGVRQDFGPLAASARLLTRQGDGEPVRDGINRPVGNDMHAWRHAPGDWISYEFAAPVELAEAALIADTALHMDPQMSYWHPLGDKSLTRLPAEMPHTFRLEGKSGGAWTTIARVEANRRRLVRIPVNRRVEGLRYVLEKTWGPCDGSSLYAFYPVART